MSQKELITILNDQLQVELPEIITEEELELRLAEIVDHLIERDFKKLVYVLYKIDVSEVKLKQMLNASQQQRTSTIIAKLIIERQKQKIESRKKFSSFNKSDEEKW